jgi:hypothetical protein
LLGIMFQAFRPTPSWFRNIIDSIRDRRLHGLG